MGIGDIKKIYGLPWNVISGSFGALAENGF